MGSGNGIESKKEFVAAGDFTLETSEYTDEVCPACMQILFFSFFFIQKWEERAVSAAIDENQTPSVWWQAAISRSAVFVLTEIWFVVLLAVFAFSEVGLRHSLLTFRFMSWFWCFRFI